MPNQPTSGNHPEQGLLGPAALQLHPDHVRVGQRWQQTFAISGYPREVGYGWLNPLLAGAGELDLSLHVEPFPSELAAQRLQKQRARFESTRRLEREKGTLTDLGVAAAAEDAHQLANRLARGESRLFRAALYLSVSATSEDELRQASARVKALCASQLLSCVPASFRALDGWLSTLPLGLDRLRLRRTFDSEALAASFPSPPPNRRCKKAAASTASPSRARRSSSTVSPRTTTTASSSLAPAPARATSPSSKRCGCSTKTCMSSSSTPKTNTAASATPSAAPTYRSPAKTRSRSTRSTFLPAQDLKQSTNGSPSWESSSS